MIRSYRNRETERFAAGRRVRRWDGIADQARSRLRRLEAAVSLLDLRNLPSNRLEALSGDRMGQFSIRINTQWRICFNWFDGDSGPSNVEIVDYH
jgi:proteic killer suppression protein